jgi:2-polyprenyl-6-methoxyphenol hydroxylase-like FAD-dependent oxidoreductase
MGVPSIVFEKAPSVSWHPKTRNFSTRFMEIVRQWSPVIEKRFRTHDLPPGWKRHIRFFDTVLGTEYGNIETDGFFGPGLDVSPSPPIASSQDITLAVMVDGARATGLVDIRFNSEVVGLARGAREYDTDVAVQVKDVEAGTTRIVEGPALVATDGAGSFIRREAGIELLGHRGLQNVVNIYWRGDLDARLADRQGGLLFVNTDDAQGVLQPLDAKGRFLSQVTPRADDWSPSTFTPDRAREWLHQAIGDDSVEVEILDVGFWELNSTIAKQFIKGRVVLCGDAAHQISPTGGLGVNTGLQGMHNVMWKLAWYLKGWSDWSLVQTYETERYEATERTKDQSLQNSLNVVKIRNAITSGGAATDVISESHRYGNHVGVELGTIYTEGAVLPDGSSPPAPDDPYTDYIPTGMPGARAPHIWLGDRELGLSTLDLWGQGLTVLAAEGGDGWEAQAQHASASSGIQIDFYRIGTVGLDDHGTFEERYGIGHDGAVLVRPDGHVAHRAQSLPAAPDALASVVHKIFGS